MVLLVLFSLFSVLLLQLLRVLLEDIANGSGCVLGGLACCSLECNLAFVKRYNLYTPQNNTFHNTFSGLPLQQALLTRLLYSWIFRLKSLHCVSRALSASSSHFSLVSRVSSHLRNRTSVAASVVVSVGPTATSIGFARIYD